MKTQIMFVMLVLSAAIGIAAGTGLMKAAHGEFMPAIFYMTAAIMAQLVKMDIAEQYRNDS